MRRREIECREMTMCLGRDGSVRRRVKAEGWRREEGGRSKRSKRSKKQEGRRKRGGREEEGRK